MKDRRDDNSEGISSISDACEFCSREKATEPIYDEQENREIWICSACDSKIEWMPANASSYLQLKGGAIEYDR